MTCSFENFLHLRRADLQRIANATRGEHSLHAVHSEAWLTAIEISQRRRESFDFASEDDQDQLLAWLHQRLVKWADTRIRHALTLSHGSDGTDRDGTGAMLARMLTAPLETDPQMQQELVDERDELLERVLESYSEAAAYMLLLLRVHGSIVDMAELLWTSTRSVRYRMKCAGLLALRQPTLYDGIVRIPPDFQPWRKRYLVRSRCSEGAYQLAFEME